MDKIDIKDLRVGDWVHCITDNANHRIDSFGIDDRIEVYGNPWYIYDGKINILSDIEPIPLTEEILEKNRWKKQPIPYTSSKNCIGIWRDSKSVTTIKQFFIDRDSSIFVLIGGYSKVGNIKYVHQLQNILRDLGIDKEIII